MSCAGATAATVPRRSFRPPTKEAVFFPFFFFLFDKGARCTLCASASSLLPQPFFFFEAAIAFVCLLETGVEGRRGHLIRLLCKPEGQPQHSWPLQTVSSFPTPLQTQPQTNTTITATLGLSDGQQIPRVIAISICILATVGSLCQHYTPLIFTFSMTLQKSYLLLHLHVHPKRSQYTPGMLHTCYLAHLDFSSVYTAEMSGISGD